MNRFQVIARSAVTSPVFRCCLSGAIAGVCLVGVLSPMRLLLGFGNAVDSAVLLVSALCLWAARFSLSRFPILAAVRPYGLVMATCWTLCAPVILNAALQLVNRISLLTLESTLLQYGVVLVLTIITLAPAVLTLAMTFQHERLADRRANWNWLISCGCCSVWAAVVLLPWIGSQNLTWLALICSVGMIAGERWLWNRSDVTADVAPPQNAPLSSSESLPQPVMASLTGAALAVVFSVAAHLIQRNLVSDLALFAGVLVSYGAASWIGRRSTAQHSRMSPARGLLLLSAWIAVIAAGYPLWTWMCLQMNARCSSIWLLLLMRVSLLMAFVFPAGFLLKRVSSLGPTAGQAGMPLLCAAAALIVFPWINWSTETAALVTMSAAFIAAMTFWAMEGCPVPARAFAKITTLSLTCAALLGMFSAHSLDATPSEKILFSGQTLQMARQGTSMAKLQWADDGRPVAAFENLNNRLSVWKYHGSQLVVKKNGLSSGLHSTRPSVCPNSAADVLPTLLPLTFHPGPQDVLLLDMHPTALLTCQSYPLRLVRTLDNTAVGHQLLSWLSEHDPSWNLTGGPEFQFGRMDPLLAMYSSHECNYDVIVCPWTHPASAGAASYTSQEFYRQVAGHLNEEGIFAQRVPYYDLNPEFIKTLTLTMQSVFSDVIAFESIPGELVFLCGKQQLPRVDEELIGRMKTPQCRRLLSESGWDWSMLLGRGSLTSVELEKFMVGTGHLANRFEASNVAELSIEVSRWGGKGDATRDALAQTGTTLRTLLKSETLSLDVTQRLEDLNLAHQLQKDHPNDPWGYRGSLKNRLKDRPRSELVQVKYEGLKRVLDEEDRRRKEYLQQLGEIVKEPRPTAEMIRQLTSYEAPFDPLVSLFVHYEAIQLMDRCPSPDQSLHLANLLRTVYFANGLDQSVRNVSTALELISSDKSSDLSTQDRWDEANSLLQMLAYRWQLRWQSGKTSRYDTVDTEHSAKAVDHAIKMLGQSAAECGVTPAEWEQRRENLEQSLIRPLRQHRSAQLKTVTLAPQEAPVHAPAPASGTAPNSAATK